MADRRKAGERCGVEGCKNFCVRGEEYCAAHLRQYQNNLAVGAPDPRPTRLARNRRKCWARNCRNVAIPFSHYCALHVAQYQDPQGSVETITNEFADLMLRLEEGTPDCVTGIRQELELLKKVRRVLAAYTEASSRSGWKAMSAISFTRLWLSSAQAANQLLQAWFVMSGGANEESALMREVYEQIEQMPGPRQIKEGMMRQTVQVDWEVEPVAERGGGAQGSALQVEDG